MTNEELIQKAASIINVKRSNGDLIGDVGCALISSKDNLYNGVCASVGSNSFCAEQIAIGAMITAGEYDIKKIVAVWKDDKGVIYIVSPCGNCRQFMYQINEKNLETDIILDKEKVLKLKDLLPYHIWYKKQI